MRWGKVSSEHPEPGDRSWGDPNRGDPGKDQEGTQRPRSRARRLTLLLLTICVVVGAVLGVRAVGRAIQAAPVTKALRTRVEHVQTLVMKAPAAVSEDQFRNLLASAPGVVVLGTSTRADGRVEVDISVWTSIDTGWFSPVWSVAKTCERVLVEPARSVSVAHYGCPAQVPLEAAAGGYAVSSTSMHEVEISLPELPIIPVDYRPCYSGSGDCN